MAFNAEIREIKRLIDPLVWFLKLVEVVRARIIEVGLFYELGQPLADKGFEDIAQSSKAGEPLHGSPGCREFADAAVPVRAGHVERILKGNVLAQGPGLFEIDKHRDAAVPEADILFVHIGMDDAHVKERPDHLNDLVPGSEKLSSGHGLHGSVERLEPFEGEELEGSLLIEEERPGERLPGQERKKVIFVLQGGPAKEIRFVLKAALHIDAFVLDLQQGRSIAGFDPEQGGPAAWFPDAGQQDMPEGLPEMAGDYLFQEIRFLEDGIEKKCFVVECFRIK